MRFVEFIVFNVKAPVLSEFAPETNVAEPPYFWALRLFPTGSQIRRQLRITDLF